VSYFQSAALPSQAFFPGFFSPAFFFLFYARILMENAAPQDQAKLAWQTLCEPAQSKCTWTCHKSNFMLEFTGKMLKASWSTLIKHRPLGKALHPTIFVLLYTFTISFRCIWRV
jgi:hypothetical protein